MTPDRLSKVVFDLSKAMQQYTKLKFTLIRTMVHKGDI